MKVLRNCACQIFIGNRCDRLHNHVSPGVSVHAVWICNSALGAVKLSKPWTQAPRGANIQWKCVAVQAMDSSPQMCTYIMEMRVGQVWAHEAVGTSTQLASQVSFQLHHTSIYLTTWICGSALGAVKLSKPWTRATQMSKYTMKMRVGQVWAHDALGTNTQLVSQVSVRLHHTFIYFSAWICCSALGVVKLSKRPREPQRPPYNGTSSNAPQD